MGDTEENGDDLVSQRKKRKIFRPSYEDAASESDIEQELITETAFDLNDKVFTQKFDDSCLKIVQGKDLTISYFQKHGFAMPLLCKEKTGLGMRVPPTSFTITDVKNCVGGNRMLDVMNVSDQSSLSMTMEEWQQYYDSKNKTRLLNVISLEFSLTKLDRMVSCPIVVRKMDWVNTAWPGELKARQADATNNMSQMMYPKVQKYCLMSVKGCYTDFHIDFGGTSVWYHIIRGGKVFWLVPPTENNLKLYEEWTLSGRQSSVFFGDLADECYRVNLRAGYTFFIPAGWIHAVYTPDDSLVFGGNFLHSFAIERQLKTAQIEDLTKVPQKFRYPFYSEMLWYVLARYVEALLGVQHLDMAEVSKTEQEEIKPAGTHIHLTPFELSGIKAIVMYLHALPANRKNIPDLVKDPVALIRDVRSIVELHRNDKVQASITGEYVLSLAVSNKANLAACLCEGETDELYNFDASSNEISSLKKRGRKPKNRYLCEDYESPKISPKKLSIASGTPRRRRTRCRECTACLRDDCGECIFCADMVKFGGQGKAKQTCKARQCLRPLLPVTATCLSCHLDGWLKEVTMPMAKPPKDVPSALMECSSCYEIVHPKCLEGEYDSQRGVLNEEMPNSWVCPKCVFLGKDHDVKPRHFKARDTYLKLKGEDPSTSCALSGRESITPVKLEHSSPTPSPTKRKSRDRPPRLSLSSPVPEVKWRCETPDFRPPSEMRPQSTEEYVEKIEIRRKSDGSRKRASDEYVIEHRKKVVITEQRIDSRAESRHENEERLYAAIQKTRECLNFETLRELAIATGRTIKLPSVVVRPPLTEQQITNLAKMEQEEKERELKAKMKKEEKPKVVKPKTEKVKVEEEKLKMEEEEETPQRMTRLKAEKAKELETRVTRRRANSKTDSTPEKSGIRTRKGKVEEEEMKRKTRSDEKSKTEEDSGMKTRGKNEKGKTATPDLKKRGKVEEEKAESESSLRRGRSAVSDSPCESPTTSRVTRGRPSRVIESPQSDQKKTPEKKIAQTPEAKTRKSTKETPGKEKENAESQAVPSSASPVVTLRSSRSRSLLVDPKDEDDKKEELEEKKGKKKEEKKGNDKKNTPEKSKGSTNTRSKGKDAKSNDDRDSDAEMKTEEKVEVKSEVESSAKDAREPELSVAIREKVRESSDGELSPPILEKQPSFSLPTSSQDVSSVTESKIAEASELPTLKLEPDLVTNENVELKEAPRLDNENVISENESPALEKPTEEVVEKMEVVPVTTEGVVEEVVEEEPKLHEVLEKAEHLIKIFRYLTEGEMVRCCLVSRAWCKAAMRPELHRRISLTNKVATREMLKYIVRRQPLSLDLSWTEISHAQLKWAIVRLPKLKELRLAGNNVATAFALTEFLCPSLEYLDLGFTSGLNDGFLRDVFVPKNQVQRPPGATNRKPRLQGLKKLRLSSCNITDAGLLILSENLKNLTHIDLSQCWRTTALGLSQFLGSPNVKQLEAISLAGCPQVTDELVDQLLTLDAVQCIDVRYNCKISAENLSSYLKALQNSGREFENENGGILKAHGFCSDW